MTKRMKLSNGREVAFVNRGVTDTDAKIETIFFGPVRPTPEEQAEAAQLLNAIMDLAGFTYDHNEGGPAHECSTGD